MPCRIFGLLDLFVWLPNVGAPSAFVCLHQASLMSKNQAGKNILSTPIYTYYLGMWRTNRPSPVKREGLKLAFKEADSEKKRLGPNAGENLNFREHTIYACH